MVGSTLVFARVQSSLPVAKSNAVRLLPPPYTLPSPGAARTVFKDGESYHRITFPVVPSTRRRFFLVVGPAKVPPISKSPVSPYGSMSHTSASVPPSFGAMGLNLLVCESRTARLPTLPKTVPSRLVTWEMRPPSQTLLPTCLMALTRPSTIGVLSGFWEGNASTAPLARRRPAAVENSNKRAFSSLSPSLALGGGGKDEAPHPVTRNGRGNNTPVCARTDTSAGGSTSPGTLPHKQLPRPPSTRSSQNAGKTKFAESPFHALG